MSRLHGTKDFWIGALRAEGPAFAAAIAQAPPETPVLSCPGWTVTDLTLHLAGVYHWVHGVAGAAATTAPVGGSRPPRPGPDETPLELWQQAYDQLMARFDALDPEAPAWNWAPQPKKAGFWPRRMAHETAVHRWDAQLAIAAGEPIESKLAADGVSEVLDTWLPAGRRRPGGPWHGLVQLSAADAGQEWFLRLRGEGVALLDTATILDHDAHHARVQVSGTASDLLLALWGRVSFDTLTVAGDRTLLAGLRAD
ncbi:maleylpyruvate isomerase N-terminal domain-containing protein [Micromonospora sp. WMMA1363]|uniref:maleylpyruvate isomerase N-terminal domain-containing protein n=1 Tax=Micromonospora sp. WMMA1363 TaxID=3053985 RepID=UPI00259CA96A|nr:maleylpyruvate isomerase N-terminal domain-containing protein [Micromonospora sp. WMMA1363]MDM4720985.1 maleylpyruvate isomerase N-terminal domain-containing protein [Micromonospora sp. WMMA1363]